MSEAKKVRPEFVFRLTGLMRDYHAHANDARKAADEATDVARKAADEMLAVEKLLEAMPGVMEGHCCRPTWKKSYSDRGYHAKVYHLPVGCTPDCTTVYEALHRLGVLESAL